MSPINPDTASISDLQTALRGNSSNASSPINPDTASVQQLSTYMQQQDNPQDVQNAQAQLGSQDQNGECERFIEKSVYGKTGIFPTASDAANYYSQKGQLNPDIQNAPAGSMIYFKADGTNGNDGHVGLLDAKGNLISATYNGVQTIPLQQWISSTRQTPLGFVKP
jgi:uncharacterized protein YycO